MSSHQPNPLDQHIIETPEQIDLHFQVAGIGSRFLAIALDTLIQSTVVLLLAFGLPVLARFGLLKALGSLSQWFAAALIVFFFLLYFGYFALFEIFWNGQTPGKRVTGIRVVKDSGRPLNPLEVVARNLLRIVDQLPGFYGIGILVAMLNQQSKRLGDYVAGSIVIREGSLARHSGEWSSPPTGAIGLPLGANLLTPEEAGLIDAFLARRHELTDDVRYRMAREILKRMQQKLPNLASGDQSPETKLAALYEEYRSNAHL